MAFLIDFIDHIEITEDDFYSIHALSYLPIGISQIAYQIRLQECEMLKSNPDLTNYTSFSMDTFGLEACMFHWFSVSSINFFRLIATVDFKRKNNLKTVDITTAEMRKKLNNYCTEYAERISPEMAAWRNKISAHFSFTMPYPIDDVASLDNSVVVPVSYCNKYFMASAWQPAWTTSPLPSWSLTQQFEKMQERFWPFREKLPPLTPI